MLNSLGLKSPTVRLQTGLPDAARARTSAPMARMSEPEGSCAIVETRGAAVGALAESGRRLPATDWAAALRGVTSIPASFRPPLSSGVALSGVTCRGLD